MNVEKIADMRFPIANTERDNLSMGAVDYARERLFVGVLFFWNSVPVVILSEQIVAAPPGILSLGSS